MPQAMTAIEMEEAGISWEIETSRFLKDARGVIHVGAGIGQEAEMYADLGLPVIWIEPLDGVFDLLRDRIVEYSNQQAFQYLITNMTGDAHEFGISNNGGQSSSIYNFKQHRDIWPDVTFVASATLKSASLQWVIAEHNIDLDIYDTLILDVQGAELLALKGAGYLLPAFRWIRAECADFEAYEGGCQLKDLDAYLIPRGFRQWALWPAIWKENIGTYYEVLYKRL